MQTHCIGTAIYWYDGAFELLGYHELLLLLLTQAYRNKCFLLSCFLQLDFLLQLWPCTFDGAQDCNCQLYMLGYLCSPEWIPFHLNQESLECHLWNRKLCCHHQLSLQKFEFGRASPQEEYFPVNKQIHLMYAVTSKHGIQTKNKTYVVKCCGK